MKALLFLLLIPAMGSAQIPSLTDTLTGNLSNGVIHFHWRSANDVDAKEYAVVQVRPDGTTRYASGFITPLNNGGSAEYNTDVALDNNVRNAAFTGLMLLLGFGILLGFGRNFLGFGRKLLIPALACLVMVMSCNKSEDKPAIQGTPPGSVPVSNSTRGTFRLQVIQANGQIWNYTSVVTIVYP
jgi:hypothetical protein